MEETLNTVSYLIAGYAVIFGVTLGYIVSLIVRTHNLRQDEGLLLSLDQKEDES